jgi:hypothetical protein
VVPASAAAAGAAFLASEGVRTLLGSGAGTIGRLVQVGAAVGAGLVVFVASTLILRIEEADEVKVAVLRRFRG